MFAPLDYVEVEIRQEKSKYKIRETGSIMKILLILLPHRIFTEPKNSNPTGKAIPFRMIGLEAHRTFKENGCFLRLFRISINGSSNSCCCPIWWADLRGATSIFNCGLIISFKQIKPCIWWVMTGNSRWGIVILISEYYVIYWYWLMFVFYILGVICIHPANMGPDMLRLSN